MNTPIPSDRGPGILERDQAGEQKNAQKILSNQKLIINFAATNRNQNQTTMDNKVYAIEMTVGNEYSYVFDTYQIETDGGFTDIEPDWCFLTRDEAEKALAEMEAFCKDKGYINCKFRIEAIDKHIVEDIELTKGTYNTGDTLTYVVDGQQYDVTGEFWVDNDHMLHHTHICDDGTELDITTPYE